MISSICFRFEKFSSFISSALISTLKWFSNSSTIPKKLRESRYPSSNKNVSLVGVLPANFAMILVIVSINFISLRKGAYQIYVG